MRYFLLLSAFILAFPVSLLAQKQEHSHPRNEIGISPGVTYSPSHQNWGFGLHAHYFRTLGEHSPWALGGSVEQVYAHGSHWTISAGAKYTLFDRLNLAVMPGVTFFKHTDGHEHTDNHELGAEHNHVSKGRFAVHVELGYDLIHLKHFHFGPAIDYSWSKQDTHFMLGIHCAYAF